MVNFGPFRTMFEAPRPLKVGGGLRPPNLARNISDEFADDFFDFLP